MFTLVYLTHKRFKQKLEIEKRRVSAHLGDLDQFDYTTKEQIYLRMWHAALRNTLDEVDDTNTLYTKARKVADFSFGWELLMWWWEKNPRRLPFLLLILLTSGPIQVSLFTKFRSFCRKNYWVVTLPLLATLIVIITSSFNQILGSGQVVEAIRALPNASRAQGGGPLQATHALLSLFFMEAVLVSLLFLGVVAFYTLLERKGIAAVQRREGPNTTGPFGLLQPIADGAKLILKDVSPSDEADAEAYELAPILTFGISFTGWALMPVSLSVGTLAASDYNVVVFLCVATVSIFGVVGAGWATKSKYATLGSLRAISQFVAYEVYFSLLLVPFFLHSGADFLHAWERQAILPYCLPFLPLFVVFFITMLVETNRAPFDLPEAEAELVAGFNVEYSASTFALYFLGEYNSMIIASTVMSVLFLGADFVWLGPVLPTSQSMAVSWPIFYLGKVLLLCFGFVFVRANFPRVRFDQLLLLGWKVCLPISLGGVWAAFLIKGLC